MWLICTYILCFKVMTTRLLKIIKILVIQAGETDQVNTFVKYNLYRNAIRKVLSLFHGNLNVLLHVLYKKINKIHVKTEIAQNDTDLSCI